MKKLVVLAGVVLGVVVVANVGYYAHESSAKRSARPEVSPVVSDISVSETSRGSTTFYPNSVVPGGVHSVAEVVAATDDPVVKAHYANIDVSKLKKVVLTADVYASVSYRIGDKIYWTKKKQRIRTGEVVFTDGTHVIRGRCGNCYQEAPDGLVSLDEPSEEILDTPVRPAEPVAEKAATKNPPGRYREESRTTAEAGPIAAGPTHSKKWLLGFLAIPIVAAVWPHHHDAPAPPQSELPIDQSQPTAPVTPPVTTPVAPPSEPPTTPLETPPEIPPVAPATPPVIPPPPANPPPPVWAPPVQPTPIPTVIPPWDWTPPASNPPVYYLPPPLSWNPPDNPPIEWNPPIDVIPHNPYIPPVTTTPEPGFFYLIAGGMGALVVVKQYKNGKGR